MNIAAWNDEVFTFYKLVGDLLCFLQYDAFYCTWVTLPFIGHFSQGNTSQLQNGEKHGIIGVWKCK